MWLALNKRQIENVLPLPHAVSGMVSSWSVLLKAKHIFFSNSLVLWFISKCPGKTIFIHKQGFGRRLDDWGLQLSCYWEVDLVGGAILGVGSGRVHLPPSFSLFTLFPVQDTLSSSSLPDPCALQPCLGTIKYGVKHELK